MVADIDQQGLMGVHGALDVAQGAPTIADRLYTAGRVVPESCLARRLDCIGLKDGVASVGLAPAVLVCGRWQPTCGRARKADPHAPG